MLLWTVLDSGVYFRFAWSLMSSGEGSLAKEVVLAVDHVLHIGCWLLWTAERPDGHVLRPNNVDCTLSRPQSVMQHYHSQEM